MALLHAHRYLESPPRFQILHCLRNSTHGGTSLFVDAFAAAEALRVTHPAAFTQLVMTPVPFQYINDARHLHYAHPTITLDHHHHHHHQQRHTAPPLFEREQPRDDDDDDGSGRTPPTRGPRVTAVNYSPPFQACLPRDTPHEFYDALARFAALVDAPAAVYARLLGEGDAVVFDNRRILHGRTAFEDTAEDRSGTGAREVGGGGEGSNRWLKGCYFEGDTLASHGRILRARMASGEI